MRDHNRSVRRLEKTNSRKIILAQNTQEQPERGDRTLKEDLIWSREFNNIHNFEIALNQWQKDYNEDFPHSTLGYMTPYEYERWFNA